MAHVQSTKGYAHAGTIDVAYPSNVTAGNLLVLTIHGYSGGVDTITDTRGNTWVEAGTRELTGSLWADIWYCIANGSGANTVTVTYGLTPYASVTVLEYSGMVASNVLDQQVGATGSGTSVDTGNMPTTTNANDLIIGMTTDSNGTNTAITETGGQTLRQEYEDGATYMHANVADRTVSATGAYKATWTLATSSTWAAKVAAFKGVTVANSLSPRTINQRNAHMLVR